MGPVNGEKSETPLRGPDLLAFVSKFWTDTWPSLRDTPSGRYV